VIGCAARAAQGEQERREGTDGSAHGELEREGVVLRE
jgi:hypothetical protein